MTLSEFLELPDAPNGVKRIIDPVSVRGYREVCDMKSSAGKREYKRRTLEVWERDRGLCGICKTWVAPEPGILTAEHPTGRGSGGSRHDDHVDAIVPAHWRCNSLKASRRDFNLKDLGI